MAVTMRRIRVGEGGILRDVRLRALEDAPAAFASTHDGEALRPVELWEADAASRAAGPTATTFFAELDGGVVGVVGAFRAPEDPGTVELVSMWVAPASRGRHVGACLVDAVVDWATVTGAHRVALWVTRGNEAATSLYRARGFTASEEVLTLPSDPCHAELRMLRHLDRGARDGD
jgi:GNAT superfamily N-acetyltransferase